MRALILGFLAGLVVPDVAFAQSSPQNCHHASKIYSPGAMMSMGRSLQHCVVTSEGFGIWMPISLEDSDRASSNCLSGGREFSHGSIQNVSGIALMCSNGSWVTTN